MRRWQREFTVRKMVCVICDEEVIPREKILVARFRGKMVMCKKCENAVKGRIEIDEDPLLHLLGGYH